MEPYYTTPVVKEPRRFNSEAEYRLWQHNMAAGVRSSRRPNLVRALVTNVRSVLSRSGQPDPMRSATGTRQTQTMARVTK